jgi:hypothetical protein
MIKTYPSHPRVAGQDIHWDEHTRIDFATVTAAFPVLHIEPLVDPVRDITAVQLAGAAVPVVIHADHDAFVRDWSTHR